MNLNEFLSTLTSSNVQVTLMDLDTNAEIITLKASGYESLDDAIENREVKQWSITSASTVKVVLGEVLTTEP